MNVHTTLYGSAAGCRSIQKKCTLWKHGLTSKNTHSPESVDILVFLQIKYQPNIHQWRWYDMRSEDCNFYRNQTFGRRTDHLFVFFFLPQKLGILTARLNRSFSISTSNSIERGLECWSMPKTNTAIVRTKAFEKLCVCDRPCMP